MKNISKIYSRIFFGLFLFVFTVPVYAANPGVSVFGGIHANDSVGQIDYRGLVDLNAAMNKSGTPMFLYGGAPQYYINTPTPQLFGSMGKFLQESSTPSNIVWWAGHGTLNTPGGWDNTYVGRQDFFKNTRQIADSLGKDVIVMDSSCGSGACVLPEVSQYLGGHLKGVVTITGAGQLGYTGQLEQMLSNAGGFASGVDTNKDGAISMGELKVFSDKQGWPFKFAGDMNHKVFYGKNASPDKNPELTEIICEVLPPALDSPGVDDALAEEMSLAGYNSTMSEVRAKVLEEKKSAAKIYFFSPDAAAIRQFLSGLTAGSPTYDINGLKIQPGSYGIGKTILLDKTGNPKNGSAYFKVTSGDQCTAEPIKYDAPNPSSPQNGIGGLLGGGGNNGLGGGLGTSSLLPLLMQSLLGQGLGGFGGQSGYGNQNPYGNQYGQQYQDCSRIAQLPVCGSDGKTYKNSCYLQQQGVQIRSQGVCIQPTSTPVPTPIVTPNISSILQQVGQSGIPSNLIESVRNIVASVLSSILSGGIAIQETLVK